MIKTATSFEKKEILATPTTTVIYIKNNSNIINNINI